MHEIPAGTRLPDPLTPVRDITHRHFRAGDRIAIIRGTVRGQLWGDCLHVVAPSWHTPTDEDGWRLRDPDGGELSYITAHPRHLVHLDRRCADCLIHLRALAGHLLPRVPGLQALDAGWYSLTPLHQLVHVGDR
ncbi:hypothetical protein ACL02R_11580 [Streptomyces sp. MS19]|uniref:hypothetical protein n=1 Tax=Streptomyces sp. MS19 TaxID=3385972 RepID=UPI0039A1ED2E